MRVCSYRRQLSLVGRSVVYRFSLGGEELRGLPAGTGAVGATLGLIGYRGIGEIGRKREAVLEKAETSCRCTK
jgi:hypothetical protein